jgi:hypothetical protein
MKNHADILLKEIENWLSGNPQACSTSVYLFTEFKFVSEEETEYEYELAAVVDSVFSSIKLDSGQIEERIDNASALSDYLSSELGLLLDDQTVEG